MQNGEPEVKPLPYKYRQRTFSVLVVLFVVVLPFLFLYATGYRFEFADTSIVRTGGMYVAAERTGAEIYIDNELVRETRVFRTAFYAQNLDPGTHRVHVQKVDHHTWVKELPITAHRVTEAQAFNIPLSPEVRVISEWQSATGSAVVSTSSLLFASTTNPILATTTTATSSFLENTEFVTLKKLFATSSATSGDNFVERFQERVTLGGESATTSTSTMQESTTTKEFRGVRLYEQDEDIYAMWIGNKNDMPYYYCAADFEPYSTSTPVQSGLLPDEIDELGAQAIEFIHPVQSVPEDAECDPNIRISRNNEMVTSFDFYPGNSDLVVLALASGIYAVEVDDRAWQNMQPLVMGEELDMRVENGQIYVYDGELIYQMILE